MSEPIAQALDQIHSLVKHGHDDDGRVLLDEEQVVVLTTMRPDPIEPRHGSGLYPAGRDPLAAEMKRVLIDVGLGLAPCLLRVEPDVDEVFLRGSREAIGGHLRPWRTRASRLMSAAVAVTT